MRWITSDCKAAWSVEDSDPLEAITASWRIRCRLSLIWLRPFDAICGIETPSFAFDTPLFGPLIREVMRDAMTCPAASSAALLMRLPDDRRVMRAEFASAFNIRNKSDAADAWAIWLAVQRRVKAGAVKTERQHAVLADYASLSCGGTNI